MVRGNVFRRWTPLLLALAAPGCLGGQTGETPAAGGKPCDFSRTLEENSSLGYSAAELLAELGGSRTASLTAAEDGFWQSLGIDPVPALPLAVTLTIAAAGEHAIDDRCYHHLSLQVAVTLEVGDGLIRRSGTGTLAGTRESSDLTVELAPPTPADASAESVTLDARLTSSTVAGELQGPTAQATFTGQR